MKTILTLFGICAASILLCSCVQERTDIPEVRGSGLRITFSKGAMDSGITTRAQVEPTPDEETVNTILVVFYTASDTFDGEYVTSMILREGPYNMDETYYLSDPLLSPNDAYNIVAIANIDDDLYVDGDLNGLPGRFSHLTEKQFRQNVILDISIPYESYGIHSNRIPMTGSVTKKVGESKIDLTLKRIVSRLDVVNNVSGYQIVSASVWNAYYRSSLLGDAVMDFSPIVGTRTRKYYNGTVEDNSVTGSLYVFENMVASPAQNDRFTTCLIIGLSQGAGTTRYFRVNIHPKESPQHLKRNNAYKVNINAVNGDGYGTEEEAYSGIKNELGYSINYWDLDDNGLIVSDINSMIALPVKTATFGRGGGENSYTVTTFSNLANPAPLALKSQIYSPADGSIVATLNGNILTVSASPLPDGAADRTGIITLTYAGLEASMNVLQSSSVDKFLTVTLDDDWFAELPPTAHASSENIYVNASGPWTAKLYDGGQNAFTLQTGELKTTLRSVEVSNNKFRISTYSQNATQEKREGFILISLDEDNLNFVSVVPIAQKVATAINVVPDIDRVTFDAAGNVENTVNPVYTLNVSTNGANLLGSTLDDNTHFSINETIIDNSSRRIDITANGQNYTGTSHSTILTLRDNSGGSLLITIAQNTGGLYLRPSTISSRITAVGGYSEYIAVDVGSSSNLTWSATITTEGMNGDVFNHEAYLQLSDGSYSGTNPTGVSSSVRFRVVFPKVYYPNRKKNITATVTVTLDGTQLTAPITAAQEALQSNGIYIWSSRKDHWGSINLTNDGYSRMYNNHFIPYAQVISDGQYNLTNGDGIGNNNQNPGGYSGYSLVNICNYYMPATYNWSMIRTYMQDMDGLTIFASDGSTVNGPLAAINNSPMADYQYSFIESSDGYNRAWSNSAASGTRVYRILFDQGRSPIPVGQHAGPFATDIYRTAATQIPSTGIKIIQSSDGHNNPGNGLMVIDPTNGFVYFGECSIFFSDVWMGNGSNYQYEFMYNYADFVCLATMYGSHFMDMLIDYAPGDPNAVAAPWDDVWSGNKWDPTSTSTIK